MSHSVIIDNLRQYVEFVDKKNNQMYQQVLGLTFEVAKLKKVVNKLKNGEQVDDEEENTASTDTNKQAPQMMPPQQHNPNMQFNQMPQLQTLNLNSTSAHDN